MKKYALEIIMIALALGINSFTTPKKALTHVFRFTGDASLASSVNAITTIAGTDYYTNWVVDPCPVSIMFPCCTGSDEQACGIVVDAKYTSIYLFGIRKLNAETVGSNIQFPMSVHLGYDDPNNSLDRYKVTTTENADIDIINKTHS